MADMSMELIPGKTVIRRIRRVDDTMALLAMTSFSRDAFGDIAAQAGAQGIVDKNDERDIATGLRCVADGGMYGPYGFESANLAGFRIASSRLTWDETVSDRELQVMDLVAEGLTDDAIARRLAITPATVSICRARCASSTSTIVSRQCCDGGDSTLDNGESHASEHIDGKAARQTNATVHTRRPSWYRIILACLAFAAILLTCSQLVGTQSDMAGYAYCVGLQLLLMLLVPIWPVPCSVALICCNGVFMAVGVFTGAWQWGGLLAIATLGTSPQLLGIMLETVAWAALGGALSAGILLVYCVRWGLSDIAALWLAAIRSPGSAVFGAVSAALIAGATIRESQLFRYFKDR